MIKSIPPKGSIPESIRAAVTIKTHIPRNLSVVEENLKFAGFKNKLSWLQEHLAELEENGADIDVIEEARSQVETLQKLLGDLGR